MADEKNPLECMTEQRDRLKQEVDVLNPKFDGAVAKLVIQSRDLADAAAKVDNLSSRALTAEAENVNLKSSLARTAEINERLASELAEAKGLAEQRRLALADVMQFASSLVSKVMPLLNQ